MSGDEKNNHFDPKQKQHLLEVQQLKTARGKRDAEAARAQAEQAVKTAQNIIMPKYAHDNVLDIDRETDVPPREVFIGLGWDEDKDTGRKHYRRFYPDELEKVKEETKK